MNKIPTEKENPFGFHKRYTVNKMSGEPVDKDAEYMVLRLDWGGDDKEHIKAGRVGAIAYANAVAHHLPEVAKDLILRYSDPSTPPLTSETDQPVPGGCKCPQVPGEQPLCVYPDCQKSEGLVPEEVGEWLEKQKGAFDYEGEFNHDFRAGAMAMYKRDQATIAALQSRLSQVITACQPIKDDFLVGHILKLAEGKKEGKV